VQQQRIKSLTRDRPCIGQTTGAVAPLSPSLRVGGIECDRVTRRILRNGRQLHVSPTEFDILAFLMLNEGKTFTRERLLTAIWGTRRVDLRTVDVTIGRLRKALNRNFYPDPIRSVRGHGYKFHENYEEIYLRWTERGRKRRRLPMPASQLSLAATQSNKARRAPK
jgi:DNA-binding response OmpR family regulator